MVQALNSFLLSDDESNKSSTEKHDGRCLKVTDDMPWMMLIDNHALRQM